MNKTFELFESGQSSEQRLPYRSPMLVTFSLNGQLSLLTSLSNVDLDIEDLEDLGPVR